MREIDTANSFQLGIAVGDRENKRARNRREKTIEKREGEDVGGREKERKERERNRRGGDIERVQKGV